MLNNDISLSPTYISQILKNSNSSGLSVSNSVNRSPYQDVIPTSEREMGEEGEGEGGRGRRREREGGGERVK